VLDGNDFERAVAAQFGGSFRRNERATETDARGFA